MDAALLAPTSAQSLSPTPPIMSVPMSTPKPSFLERLDGVWQRITDGLEIGQLWKQFHTDARASFRLYQRDSQIQAAQETRPRGGWQTVKEFCWAILEKLSPARRVLLLIAVLLLLFGGGEFSHKNGDGAITVITIPLQFYGGALLFILLMLEVADRVVMKRDLEIARDIQGWLLPASPPAIPGLSIAFATRPANTVAGDYYDVFARATADSPDPQKPKDPQFLFAVADVAGKSIPAALLMATFQASLKTLSATPTSLTDLVLGMNRYACSNSQNGRRFTTAFLAQYTPETRRLTFVNAGHNAPMLLRASGTQIMERLSDGGLPLGIMPDAAYESREVELNPGDWLLIFTDGLVEAENQRQEEFGEVRLAQLLQSNANTNPQDLLRRIMIDLDYFVGATPQHDDVTCLLVKAA
jgi:sigma-B regulation protein RsbU (phosphoserine phosphatase)